MGVLNIPKTFQVIWYTVLTVLFHSLNTSVLYQNWKTRNSSLTDKDMFLFCC
jgi:hypothetical protein